MSKPLKELVEEWRHYTPSEEAEPFAAEMARRLRKLDEMHQQAGVGDKWCRCDMPWPCHERQVLDGEE